MIRVHWVILIAIVFGCSQNECREVGSQITEVDIAVTRLEDQLFAAENAKDIEDFLAENQEMAKGFFHANQYPHDSILARRIIALIKDPFIDTLKEESLSAFENFTTVKNNLQGIYAFRQTLTPEKQIPEIKTIISGLYNDLYITEELLVIGIDFFIGPDATYKPLNVPYYIQRRYSPTHLPSIVAKYEAGLLTPTGVENTLLSEMIDYGKINYMVSRMLPCTPDSVIMGFTPDEMIGVYENSEFIWRHFVEKELLYETGEFVKQKYLGERPNIYEISKSCPGRVGAWLGWQIVEAYMQRSAVTLEELLQERDHHKIFSASNYKPSNR